MYYNVADICGAAPMAKKRSRAKAVVAALAARFPKCFALPDARYRPLKVGIDADLLAALDGSIPRTELIRALAMYCSSDGYLRRVLAGALRVRPLEGKPAGVVTADDEKHAKAKLAATRAKRDAAPLEPPQDRPRKHIRASEQKAESPRRLSLADLREAARRRRDGAR